MFEFTHELVLSAYLQQSFFFHQFLIYIRLLALPFLDDLHGHDTDAPFIYVHQVIILTLSLQVKLQIYKVVFVVENRFHVSKQVILQSKNTA